MRCGHVGPRSLRDTAALLWARDYGRSMSGQPGDKHAWHLFVIRLAEDQFGPSRDSFIKTLASSGIGTSVHFIPLHRMPYYRDIYRLKNADFPGAEEYFRTCISLPIYSSLSEANVTRVIAACRQGAVLR